MTTVPLPVPAQASGRTREVLDLAARRHGQSLDDLSWILRAQAHWPEWLETNLNQSSATFKGQGVLPPLTRECLHVAISGSNNCRF